MNYTLVVILSFTIAIPAFVGWGRLKRIDPAYFPFIAMLTLAFMNETISFFVTRNGHSNAINSNIYALAEGLLITMLFYKIGLFKTKRTLYYSLLIFLVVLWIADKYIISDIQHFSSYYALGSAFIYVLMSVSMINRITLVEHQRIPM